MDILIIDDDEPIVSMLTEIFHEEGYQTQKASSFAEAEALLTSTKPRLILLDLSVYNHITPIITALRNDHARTVPIILLSARNPSNEALLNVDTFLAKPFDIDDLLGLVQKYIGRPTVSP